MLENKVLDDQLKKSFRFQNRELLDNYVILAVTDVNGIIKHVSTNLCNVFSYKPSELLNKPYTFLIEKDTINTFENQFNDAKVLKTIWKGEVKHASSTDDTIWADTVITPIYDDDENHVGFILASSDITKEKTLKRINEENLLKKKHDKSVLDFMPSISSAVLLKTSSGLHKILWIIFFTIIFLIVWAYFSKIDDIVKTNGKIITSANVQKVTTLDGGILKHSFVKEGDKVEEEQILFRLSDVNYKTELEKKIFNKYSLLAKIERLKAQSENTYIQINQNVLNFNQSIMKNEVILFKTNKNRYDASINIYNEQLKKEQYKLKELNKKVFILNSNHSLIKQEIKIKEPLVRERIISKIEYLNLKRKENDVLVEIKQLKLDIDSAKSTIGEITENINETKEEFISNAKNEQITALNSLKEVSEDIKYLKEKITETIIKSPKDGIINKITNKTQGEAITPGSIIAEIIPETEFILAKVKVSPSDIGFLYIGQPVRLKFRAYDFSLFGSLESEISYISADTLIDETTNEESYIVHIKSNKKFMKDNRRLEIKPGMTVDADIITGKKTILSYVLKPIVRSLEL